MSIVKGFLIVALISWSVSFARAQARVKTTDGILEGSTKNGVTSFKGVPFAAPPIGDLRWHAPHLVE